MYSRLRQQQLAVFGALAGLFLAVLACTSNDTLFIQLTPTPTPTITPTPLAILTKLKVGDKVWTVSPSFTMEMFTKPGTGLDLNGLGQNTTCFPNTPVTIQDVSKDVDNPSSELILYKVNCGSADGWLAEYSLTRFNPAGSNATVKSTDGKGVVLYSEPDQKSKPVSTTPCADGTQVTTRDVSQNPNVARIDQDPNLYVNVTCGSESGYVIESMLEPTSS